MQCDILPLVSFNHFRSQGFQLMHLRIELIAVNVQLLLVPAILHAADCNIHVYLLTSASKFLVWLFIIFPSFNKTNLFSSFQIFSQLSNQLVNHRLKLSMSSLPTFDILERRKTKFVLWIPGQTAGSATPELILTGPIEI